MNTIIINGQKRRVAKTLKIIITFKLTHTDEIVPFDISQ